MLREILISDDWSQITVSRVVLIKLIGYLETESITLHLLCFIEHHMEEQDLLHFTLAGYILGSSFCLCVFVRKYPHFRKINISHTCKERDLEIFSMELETISSTLFI